MTALTVTMEDALQTRARELRTTAEYPTCDNARETLTRDYLPLLRSPHERGVSLYATEGR